MDYSGMTVNERLFVSGKLDRFDNAVATKNVKRVIKILKAVDLNIEDIKQIIEHLGLTEDQIES